MRERNDFRRQQTAFIDDNFALAAAAEECEVKRIGVRFACSLAKPAKFYLIAILKFAPIGVHVDFVRQYNVVQLKGFLDQRCLVILFGAKRHDLPRACAQVAIGVARCDALGRGVQDFGDDAFNEVCFLFCYAKCHGFVWYSTPHETFASIA